METKKKRVRPTVAQVKALEAELAQVKENYRLQMLTDKHLMEEVKFLNQQLLDRTVDFDKVEQQTADILMYRQAMLNFSVMLRDTERDPALLKQASEETEPLISLVYHDIRTISPRPRDIARMRSEFTTLQQSNKLMEQELERKRAEVDKYVALMKASVARCKELENRGFWRRLFNLSPRECL